MHDKLFETALGISAPWAVKSVDFDVQAKRLTVSIDFVPGTHFGVSGHDGLHPVHDTVAKEYRHLNFFQHECHLRVRTRRVKLPDGSVRLVEPEFAGRLSGFTLLFEALILTHVRLGPGSIRNSCVPSWSESRSTSCASRSSAGVSASCAPRSTR